MYVENNTPFHFTALPGYDKEGREVLTNVVKGTFSLHGNRSLMVADEQAPISMADEYRGDPGLSPIRYESDLAIYKPFSDLILTGSACHPEGKKIRKMEVAFGCGTNRKKAAVECPEAVEKIPLALLDNFVVGKGGKGSRSIGTGFGFYPKQYPPRSSFAGTYDERWKRERFPFLPPDFDYRFFQAAYPELITEHHLRGNERVFAENVSPGGMIVVDLPGIDIVIESVFARKRIQAAAVLDTVVMDTEGERMLLVWRQMLPCQGMVQDIQGFRIDMVNFR
jgi:hypothetical protein